MDTKQINDALDRIFHQEEARIVFWNDPEREFLNVLPFLLLDGVTTLRLDQEAALGVKIRLERDDPAGKYLLYSPSEEPDYENDWLLDIRLYSRSFRADRASILLDQLGLHDHGLRQHLADRRKFFDSKERHQKIKTLVVADDAAADLDRKMIAVVAKADQPELFNLVRTIFHAWIEAGSEFDLDNPPVVWGQFEKFDLDAPFWQMVKAVFGYEEENPTLKMFLLRLMLTDYAHHLKGDVPQAIRGLLLPPDPIEQKPTLMPGLDERAIWSLNQLKWGLTRLFVDGLLYWGDVRSAFRELRTKSHDDLIRFFSMKQINSEYMRSRGQYLPLNRIADADRYLISEILCKALEKQADPESIPLVEWLTKAFHDRANKSISVGSLLNSVCNENQTKKGLFPSTSKN